MALLNFLLAAFTGLTLRLAFVVELPIDYFYFKHAHSHIALLGWLYMALFALLNYFFLPSSANLQKYNRLFWVTEGSVIGMYLSFLWQGYGGVSITFSIFHIILSYVYIYYLWVDLRAQKNASVLLLRTALVWLFISTLGALSMGPIVALGFKNSIYYHMVIQFFLHFQLNGWLTFGLLAILWKQMEEQGSSLPNRSFQVFYGLLVVSSVLTYALAVAWASHTRLSYWVNGVGVALQLGALGVFLHILKGQTRTLWRSFSPVVRLLYGVAILAFIIKIIMQSGAVVPIVAKMSHTIRHLVIGFIHLLVLGFVTPFLLGAGVNEQLLSNTRLTRWGAYTLLTGIVSTEFVLFLQGLFFWLKIGFLPYYHSLIFGFSILLVLGVLLVIVKNFKLQK